MIRTAYLALLGFALTVSLVVAQQGENDYILKDGTKCPPEGTATSTKGKTLNRLKNRLTAPDEDTIDPEVSLTAMLAPGRDVNRFDQEKGARITAFVVDVKPGGVAETCNCGATDLIDMDTHIELGLSAESEPTQRVIVEVTPRLRKQMGESWSTPQLQQKFKKQWVEVTGWLMFDVMHVKEAENTHPGGKKNWRATCWEIHPVTSIKVLDSPPDALAALKPGTFKALHAAHAAHVATDPKAQAAIEKRNEKLLSEFDKKELEEAEEENKKRNP
jgi:hypothetical protein